MTDIFEELARMRQAGTEGVLTTVVEKEGHGPAVVGTRMLVKGDGSRLGTVGGGALEFAAIKYTEQVMKDRSTGMKKYLMSPENEIIEGEDTGMMCGGSISLFYEYIGPGVRLYVFGAGHVGKALVYHLRKLGYYITIMDSREGMVVAVEGVQQRATVKYNEIFKDETPPAGGFYIIASHSHALDYVILKRIYEAVPDPEYVGLIASKRKAPELIKKLKEEMGPDINLDILYSPIGLEIGGSSPDEIAISIISELQAIRFGKTGHKHLRHPHHAGRD